MVEWIEMAIAPSSCERRVSCTFEILAYNRLVEDLLAQLSTTESFGLADCPVDVRAGFGRFEFVGESVAAHVDAG